MKWRQALIEAAAKTGNMTQHVDGDVANPNRWHHISHGGRHLRLGSEPGLWTRSRAGAILLKFAAPPRQAAESAGETVSTMSLGTQIYTWLRGELVGTDEFGNRYYRSGKSPLWGRDRRWVMYKGFPEASMVPPEWHSWLHHTTESPLTEPATQARPWQKEHVPNLSGTPDAYRPKGHVLEGGKRARATGDYEAWTPE